MTAVADVAPTVDDPRRASIGRGLGPVTNAGIATTRVRWRL